MVLLRGVLCHEVHHPGVRIVLVMERSDPHVSQDTKVARAASHHSPEEIIIVSNQHVFVSKLAFFINMKVVKNSYSLFKNFLACLVSRQ